MPEMYELNYCREKVSISAQSTPSRKMETAEIQSAKQNFPTENPGNFFNETLDLSHEDIQRTLSANMPMCELEQSSRHSSTGNTSGSSNNKTEGHETGETGGVIVSEMNPMDFMEGKWNTAMPSGTFHTSFFSGTDIVVSPTHVVDDDVFVNLDAFDMLGEFPELEVLESGAATSLLDVPPDCASASSEKTSEQQSPPMDYREGTANITDYSPEWAYPEGGVKVLVTGPWYSTTSPYTVLFDTFPVPTTLVQSGVLRCYCPGKWNTFPERSGTFQKFFNFS